jgi:aldehyde dehydrogenase (NAD+)
MGIARSETTSGAFVGGQPIETMGPPVEVRSPVDRSLLGQVRYADASAVDRIVAAAGDAFAVWRRVPAPERGEFVRRIGSKLRQHKEELAELVTLEAGKIKSEALGEVREMIDICDFAVGLSRQLYGLTIASERPSHRIMEQWHPLGPVAVITAFNFPVAVWAWNAAIGLVCGDPIIWKPSEKTPLTAIATHRIVSEALAESPNVPGGVVNLVVGGRECGEILAKDARIPLVSATGSVRMGTQVGIDAANRMGRSLLELGGNNAMILTPSADLELAVRAITFAAVGTAGQRCTTLRRLIVHKNVKEQVLDRLKGIYARLKIGDPRDDGVLVGPLINESAAVAMKRALAQATECGGRVFGGERITAGVPAGCYVAPALIDMPTQAPIVHEETFAPILYVMSYENLEEAIELHNAVPQGLSSTIFTTDLREAELFLSPAGSDCGIANVNIGTSGAEIGGAFGGEKQTGGGRESGSDAWKSYMRRVTNTINYGSALPLAQGVTFDV